MPGRARGASTAWKRVPSASRTSTCGTESSRRRPPAAASRWARRRTAASSGKVTSRALEAGAAVDVDRVGAVDQDVGDVGQPQQRLERARAEDVAAQRLVDGEHRRVTHRSARGPQRLGHPVRRQRTRLAGQVLPDVLHQVGATPASRGPRGRRTAATPAPSPRPCPAARDASAPGRARGRSPRRARAGRPSAPPPARRSAGSRVWSSTPAPRTTSARPRDRRTGRRRARRRPARARSARRSPARGRTGSRPPRSARPSRAGRSTTTVSWPRRAADSASRTAKAWRRRGWGPAYQVSTRDAVAPGQRVAQRTRAEPPGGVAQPVPPDAVDERRGRAPGRRRARAGRGRRPRTARCAPPSGPGRRRTSSHPSRRCRRPPRP